MSNFTITSNIEERVLVEHLLNMFYSGIERRQCVLVLSLHAMAHNWHYQKLMYYVDMMGEYLQ